MQPGVVTALASVPSAAMIAVGAFDGVHRGHRAILRAAAEAAAAAGREAWAVTFDGHPLALLDPARAPKRILGPDEEFRRLAAAGIPRIACLKFTAALAAVEAEAFAERFREASLFCGEDWRFGRGARGTPAFLRARGIAVTVLPYAEYRGERISSTAIRAAVADGRLDDAAGMLGAPWSVVGTVVHGRHLATDRLGVPTLNIPADPLQAAPPRGVYPAWARFGRERWPAVVNFGTAPSLKGEPIPLYEAHLIGFEGDLYGRTVTLDFDRAILRRECRFDSFEALRARILADREAVKGLLR